MCGIAGITKPLSTNRYARVFSTLARRGPDGHDVWADDQVTLFHGRLAIIDVLARSNQPMVDSTGRYILVFNGEIYNYKVLREQFKAQYQFRTTSDTEVILAGYILHGHKIWSMLSGMFAAVIYDLDKEVILLARDHAGIKPLFYSTAGGALSFGSEMKSVFALNPELTAKDDIEPSRLNDYFVLGYIASPDTLYKRVNSLPRAHYAEYRLRDKNFSIKSYPPVVYGVTNPLETTLTTAVIEHLESDVPVALFFSGGIDSSLIAAILERQQRGLQAFSLSMPGRTADEDYGNKIAAHLGISIERSIFDQAAFDQSYAAVRTYLDVPLADVALFPTYFISSLAAAKYKVVLSGEGGDELFYGYRRQISLRHNRHSGQALLRAYLALPNHPGKGRVFVELAKRLDAAGYYISQGSPSLSTLGVTEYTKIHDLIDKLPQAIDIDKEFYLENMLLRKLDQMTMATSLEGRVPLLSPRLYPYSDQVGARDITDELATKRALKEVLRAYVPSELIDRPKSGFGFRPEVFMRENNQVYEDFTQAYWFLKAFDVPFTRHSRSIIWERFPGLALAATLLVRSIENQSV